MNSQPFESNYNKLRVIIQAYLNTNKTWIANDFRGTDPMEVDHIGKSKGKRAKARARARARAKATEKGTAKAVAKTTARAKAKARAKAATTARAKATAQAKAAENLTTIKKGHFAEHLSTCVPCGFGTSSWNSLMVRLGLRGANGKPLKEYGKRQIWLRICGQTKRYDFRAVNVTKPILSASCLCEQGVETHLAKKSLLRFGEGHEPLIRKGGVYFVKAQTVECS